MTMEYTSYFINSPWIYAAFALIISVLSILCSYIYTRHKQRQLDTHLSNEAKPDRKEDTIGENIKGSDAMANRR